jgi:DNA-directed RNA polymerase subunit RPC12/RpoP
MGDVIDMKGYRDGWMAAHAICLNCKHEWGAAAPVGTHEFECPKCESRKGVPKEFVAYDEAHLICKCGNKLFHITPEFIYCACCAEKIRYENT